jgi:hypothetical protein
VVVNHFGFRLFLSLSCVIDILVSAGRLLLLYLNRDRDCDEGAQVPSAFRVQDIESELIIDHFLNRK